MEEQFDALVSGVNDYAIFILDPTGHVLSWNAGAERLKGYRAEEIIGQSFTRFYPQEAIEAAWPESELRQAELHGRFEDEDWRIRKDGSRFWANVVITALWNKDGSLRGFLKVTRDLTERKLAEERLRQANADLEHRVQARTAELALANRRLQGEMMEKARAEEALKDADQRKNEFLAMLGHELRNPLASLRNSLHLLKIPELNDADMKMAREVMERQVEQLVRLVDDLLDVSRIVRGQIVLRKERVDVSEVLTRAVETIRPIVDVHGHELILSLPPGPLPVEVDPIRLSQVVVNLLDNAAKYTKQAGRIWLSAGQAGDQAVIRIRDLGVGMDPELLPHIFDVFVQDKRPLARQEGGLGIGLTLVKRLIELHGGTVTASSEGPGRGSEFVVRLPALAVAPSEGTSEPRQENSRSPVLKPRRASVLVVDDNVDAALTLAKLLRMWGYQVETAYDGPSALETALAAHPEVVLLDIGLPGMDGYEVAKRLRAEPVHGSVLLAAVTGYGQREDQERAREAGFDRHFTKPVNLDIVHEFLATALPAS